LAEEYYKQGLTLEPTDWHTSYFLLNNRGYSLNQLGRFEEAEGCCRAATQSDPLLYNAWKNLGVALEGLGLYFEAAKACILAIRVCPLDRRAFTHLAALVKAHHDAVAAGIPDIDVCLTRFARIVDYAAAGRLEELVEGDIDVKAPAGRQHRERLLRE
jgi:tetratricopeptide (TPR) repeat protein